MLSVVLRKRKSENEPEVMFIGSTFAAGKAYLDIFKNALVDGVKSIATVSAEYGYGYRIEYADGTTDFYFLQSRNMYGGGNL